jgi:hypothetical protein
MKIRDLDFRNENRNNNIRYMVNSYDKDQRLPFIALGYGLFSKIPFTSYCILYNESAFGK